MNSDPNVRTNELYLITAPDNTRYVVRATGPVAARKATAERAGVLDADAADGWSCVRLDADGQPGVIVVGEAPNDG